LTLFSKLWKIIPMSAKAAILHKKPPTAFLSADRQQVRPTTAPARALPEQMRYGVRPNKIPINGKMLQATGNRQQATGNRQQATGNRQQATGNRQQAIILIL
jgi:hypothetical protein